MKNPFQIITRIAGVLALSLVAAARAQSSLPRSAPEAQGVSSTELLAFIKAADEQIDSMHGFLLVRHGHVIAEGWWTPYTAERPHMLYSLSKSFTSTAVGLAVAEGKLSIDDPVLNFFPEAAPAEVSNNLKAMRVRDLLTMSTGHQEQPAWAADTISPETFLAHPVPHLPGTHFQYNTPATFMLSAIVQKQTGRKVVDYLGPRLFEPLGIAHPVWDETWQGISQGGTGLHVRTEDIAKFGQLYLQYGEWNGRQLIPRDWVDLATSRQVSNGSNPDSDWNQGYGFQFWRCRHGAYRGDGAFGQYCVVVPEEDAVIAITSGVRNMQSVLNLLWDKLLPTFRPTSLPADAAASGRLKEFLEGLEVRGPSGAASSPQWSEVKGKTFRFAPNERHIESLKLEPANHGFDLVMRAAGEERAIPCGHGVWRPGRGNLGALIDTPLAGRFAWPEDDLCLIKVCAFETPYEFTLQLQFKGNELTLNGGSNVAFGPSRWPELTARME